MLGMSGPKYILMLDKRAWYFSNSMYSGVSFNYNMTQETTVTRQSSNSLISAASSEGDSDGDGDSDSEGDGDGDSDSEGDGDGE